MIRELAALDGTVEVKTDMQAARTGNLAVEWECYMRQTSSWEPSGVQVSRADVFAFVIPIDSDIEKADVHIVRTERLRDLVRDLPVIEANRHGQNPTRIKLLPTCRLFGR